MDGDAWRWGNAALYMRIFRRRREIRRERGSSASGGGRRDAGFFGLGEDGVVGGLLGAAFGVEEEGLAGGEPGILVGETPEGDELDGRAVAQEGAEDGGVAGGESLAGLGGEDRRRLLRGPRDVGALGVLAGLGGVDVEFGDGEGNARVAKSVNAESRRSSPGQSRFGVGLQAEGRDGNALGLKALDEGDGGLALGRIFEGKVVVAEFGGGVGFVGVLEGFGDVVVANDAPPG